MDSQNLKISHVRIPVDRPAKRFFKQAIGYLIAITCLVWVFHDIHFGEFLRSMTTIVWGWVPLAVVFDVLSYISQGMRWQLLLRPLGKLPALKTTQAIYIGLFTNEILPLRAGEFVRIFLVSRWISVKFRSIIPSIIVERLFDGIWLALAIGVVAIFVPLPKEIVGAEEILGGIVLLLTALFIILVFQKQKRLKEDKSRKDFRLRPLRALSSFFERLAMGIQTIGTSRFFFMSLMASLFILIFQIIALWLLMLAYHLHLSLWAAAVVLLILHLGTAIPNAPSNVGTYQFFTVVGLSLFGVEKTLATGFSVVAFLVLTIPLWAIGLFALGRTGLTLSGIRKEIKELTNKQTERTLRSTIS